MTSQSVTKRRREKDKTGKGERSYQKHHLIKQLLQPQIAILSTKIGRGGLLIDMHAGDGQGVPQPQVDLFGMDDSEATAVLCVRLAEKWQADVVLCETRTDRRQALRDQFPDVRILASHNRIPKAIDVAAYPWVIVLNDPNGHAHHGVDVLVHLSTANRRSDFIIGINEGSLGRHLHVAHSADDSGKINETMLKGSRQAARKYEWMMNRESWRDLLGKRYGASAKFLCGIGAYRGRILLLSNYIGNVNRGVFESW